VVIAAAAALAAGAINALAGGGTLLLYPALVALGLPAVGANLHCSVALCPGYLGAALAQRQALATQRARLLALGPVVLAGGVAGGLLLLRTGERAFEQAIPWLILLASLALAAQESVRTWLAGRNGRSAATSVAGAAPAAPGQFDRQHSVRQRFNGLRVYVLLPLLVAAVYAGYFGAGVSVVLLAVLGLAFNDVFTRLNALKQALALVANAGAVLVFAARARVDWPLIAVLAASALLGGFLGGSLADRVRPASLRRLVVVVGLALAAWYFFRLRVAAQL
jgi:hypothetical protein